jgi:hypothetical protein
MDSNLKDLRKSNTEAKGLKGELKKKLDLGTKGSKTAPQGFAIKPEADTTENQDNKAINEENKDIPTFAINAKTVKQMIGRCLARYQQGTYMIKCCGPASFFEQFLKTEEMEEHLKGKKQYTDDTNYPLSPGLPEYRICETCRQPGRK